MMKLHELWNAAKMLHYIWGLQFIIHCETHSTLLRTGRIYGKLNCAMSANKGLRIFVVGTTDVHCAMMPSSPDTKPLNAWQSMKFEVPNRMRTCKTLPNLLFHIFIQLVDASWVYFAVSCCTLFVIVLQCFKCYCITIFQTFVFRSFHFQFNVSRN